MLSTVASVIHCSGLLSGTIEVLTHVLGILVTDEFSQVVDVLAQVVDATQLVLERLSLVTTVRGLCLVAGGR